MYKIKNTFSSFHIDMGKTKLTKKKKKKEKLQKNLFPPELIDKL